MSLKMMIRKIGIFVVLTKTNQLRQIIILIVIRMTIMIGISMTATRLIPY